MCYKSLVAFLLSSLPFPILSLDFLQRLPFLLHCYQSTSSHTYWKSISANSGLCLTCKFGCSLGLVIVFAFACQYTFAPTSMPNPQITPTTQSSVKALAWQLVS